MISFKTIKKETIGEIVEKKSKFIATIVPVESRIKAEEKIKEIKKNYSDAKHNCYAYSVLEEENKVTKSSDDGEPSGTAGIPILKVITESGLCNVLVVVTRYFGGILLGTGGLVRAYTKATQEAILNSNIIEKNEGYEINIEIEYTDLDFVKYYLNQSNANILDYNYSENIEMSIEVSNEIKEEITNKNSKIGNKIQKINNIYKKYIEKKC